MLEKLIKAEAQSIVDLFTNVIKLETNTDYKDLELNFPFPYCAKTTPPRRWMMSHHKTSLVARSETNGLEQRGVDGIRGDSISFDTSSTFQ